MNCLYSHYALFGFSKFIAVCCMLATVVDAGATTYRVRAAAVDSAGVAEEFATWRIFAAADTVHPVAGAVTGADGLVDTPLDSAGRYMLDITGMSSQRARTPFELTAERPVAELGAIMLAPSATELSEIVVSAQRPLVVKEIDRLAYDVQADAEAATSPLSDILRKVPMVSVDDDGTIKINGSTNFKIYKNGRPNNSFTNNAKDIFKAIPASSIKKIEVITDPGAREDAEGVGAILNIVTDSNTALEGVLGNVSLWASSRNLVPTPNLWLSSQIGKVTFSVNGGYYNSNRKESESITSLDGVYQSTGNHLEENGTAYAERNGGYCGFEASYEPDTLNLITLEGNFYLSNGNSVSDTRTSLTTPAGATVYSYRSASYYPRNRYLDFSGVVNYQRTTRRKGETITLSYQISTTDQKRKQQSDYTEAVNAPMDYIGITASSKLNFIEQTAQADWSRPLSSKMTLDVGAKFIQRDNRTKSSRDYLGTDRATADDFTHRTSIGAAYADWRGNFGKWGMRAGLRYEFSHLSAEYRLGDKRSFGSNLSDFAPNVAVNYKIDDASTVKFSYNRRISRPGVYYLDPTVTETPLTTSQGNPRLNSATQNSLSLNYSLIRAKFNLDVTLTGALSNDQIGQIKRVVDEHSYYSYANLNRYRGASLSVYAQWSPGSKTTVMINMYGGYTRHELKEEGIAEGRFYCNPYLNVSQKLPWKLQLRGYAYWWSGDLGSVYSYSKNGSDGIGYGFNISRSFLKDDRLRVSIGARNPFGPVHGTYRSYSINSDYLGESVTRYNSSREVSLSVSYRFGSLQASVKKTAAKIQNDDLSGQKL